MEPIEIYIGRQGDGCTYQLHPKSRKRIMEHYPSIDPASRLFVGYPTKNEFEKIHGPILKHVVMVITGLSEEQINELGGFSIYDPVSEKEIAHG